MNRKRAPAAVLLLALGLPLAAQPALRLKSGRVPENLLSQSSLTAPLAMVFPAPLSANAARAHLILQFDSYPTDQLLDQLGFRDIRVLRYVPDNALLVSAPAGVTLEIGGLVLAARLEAGDKLSRLLAVEGRQVALLEMQADAAPEAAARVAQAAGLTVKPHPDVAAPYVLVSGEAAALRAAAQWDEVLYVMPASGELQRGERVTACTGSAAAELGLSGAANLATSFGDGWDGPGLGSASLSWYLANTDGRLGKGEIEAEIARAMAAWSAAVQVGFAASSTPGLRRQIDLLFASRDHGDGYAFDGPNGVLAHTFYPPPNGETRAGDMHLDQDEAWRIGSDVDLFSVVLHELGHALGLGHNDDPNSVMYAYYRRVSGLREADIAEIRKLYAAAVETPATPPEDPGTPTTPTEPTPPTDPVQPAEPDPAPANPTAPDTTAASLTITSPAASVLTTTSATLTVTGVASDDTGVSRVEWATAAGAAGTATGTANFSAGPIPLISGINQITVRAYDAAGNSSWRSLRVTRR